jgi:transcription initiation factor TFIIIB Brf1 subunit/transcription initiation factor TFIIB
VSPRFCLWGDRPGYVHVGSHTDRALQRRRKRQSAEINRLIRAASQLSASFEKLGIPMAQATAAMQGIMDTLNRHYRRQARHRRAQWPLWQDYKRGD